MTEDDPSELVKTLRLITRMEPGPGQFKDRIEWRAADAIQSLRASLEAKDAIISEKNALIDKLEAERETLITELERLLKQLGRKDLSI